MRRNSLGLFKHPATFAILLSLALTFLFGGVASAATVTSSQHPLPASAPCITATPLSQLVLVDQPAHVTVDVLCFPSIVVPPTAYVLATWGDGTTSIYPLCLEVCHVPPIIIPTTHTYTRIAIYHPSFCLAPLPVSTSPQCAIVEIEVLPPV
jgi:hypothetical protein